LDALLLRPLRVTSNIVSDSERPGRVLRTTVSEELEQPGASSTRRYHMHAYKYSLTSNMAKLF
jgi:hypothetical protein